ncbi:CRISPR-associated helicase Cas3, subtype I-F/YPEST [Methylophaga frappieri]|uniref:CRISPR-associated helicase Cas3, subtype I-F/YPEST n=1 Tax=Methylophaga frappieri (strain ATCC BAA-2434 / DSM 25690 / JAM7) TaxID=754477 RepID=I1YH10_METFJ|nr:type I-F CRISPR-associated helicase Cas3f [Methylophaga frappieri]AFJ02203.1 CRISPR-associated helicase Cas3, subtype I-F/YPEST [Methylophaga frappieri]
MMVTFVSQCEKKAHARTRRVLDAFADRIGDNTWQTVITQEGLLAVKKLLRKTASKNTAVSCHWIRSRSRSELVWVVGNKNKFNQRGIVPVNSTSTNQLYRDDIQDWQFLPVIRSLTCFAALLHDWGKASARFQQKLGKHYKGKGADRLRHEWVSCLLLKALIANTNNPNKDEEWLVTLKDGKIDEDILKASLRESCERPLADLPSVAKLVAWLIVTHHRLPFLDDKKAPKGSPCTSLEGMFDMIDKSWGYENSGVDDLASCLEFPAGLLSNSSKWLSQIKRWSGKLLESQDTISQAVENGSYRVLLHHARLSLMLGDHYFSSLEIGQTPNWPNTTGLIANTQKDKSPKQALDQHLVGVYESAKKIVGKLQLIENGLEPSFNTAELKRKSPTSYAWQNTAAKKVRDWRKACGDTRKGFFAVNMASTGCGKTFANAKVMMALSDDGDSLRYTLALGLRNLTLQTGDEYRERIFKNSDGSDLAVLIGSKAIADLHNQNKQEQVQEQEKYGSESVETLLANSDEVVYQGELPEEGLTTVLQSSKDRQLLYAPVLACTIDHIIAATETIRGGRYILPALRLLSSDLVIDEVDDFTGSDLIAIGRLIHLAGMLGRKVMISSATIPPAMAEGYFHAYQQGWLLYCKTRNASPVVGCAWIDEFSTQVEEIGNQDQAAEDYRHIHDGYIEKRVQALGKQAAKRKAIVVDCSQAMQSNAESDTTRKKEAWFNRIAPETLERHAHHHSVDVKTGLKVSFGVVRIANIQPCVQLTRFLLEYNWPEDTEVRVMAYHSRQVLLLRHEQEKHLDGVLKRKEQPGEQPQAFNNEQVRSHLDGIANEQPQVKNLLFILVATPVEEVGRDHDFDWAVIEPSSYRSIIQLAGRVKRHRDGEVEHPNIGILQYNWRTLKYGDKPREPRFCKPGYEVDGNLPKLKADGTKRHGAMESHDIFTAVDEKLIGTRLDATPRIQERQKNSKTPMALLEHAVIESQLTDYEGKGPETLQGYIQWYWYLTALPQVLKRFRQSTKSVQLYRVTNGGGDAWFTERDAKGEFSRLNTGEFARHDIVYQITTTELTKVQTARLWLQRDYLQLLRIQSEMREEPLDQVATRYGEISLDVYSESTRKAYEYNDQLGLYEQESDHA